MGIVLNFEDCKLRPITKKDYGLINQILGNEELQSVLLSKSYGKRDTAKSWHQRRGRNGFVWAISDNKDSFFGYIQITVNKGTQTRAFLGICLLEPFRGLGLGAFAIKEVEKKMQRRGFETLVLKVRNDNPALKLYERLGFELVEKEEFLLSPEQEAIEVSTFSKELKSL